MSGDPERLLSGSGGDPAERELLGSVRHVGPPDGAKDQAWRNIAGQIAVVTAVSAVSSGTAAAASKAGAGSFASWALSAKLALVAAGGLALGGGYLALRSSEPAPRAAPRPVVAPSTPEARLPAPAPTPQVVVEPAPAEPVIDDSPAHRTEPRRLDALKAESALLTEARAQLRGGNPAAAQAALDRLQAQFPKGVLTQEREVLSIEVLYARGNVEGAKRRAKAFVKAYPKSPHSAKLSRFLD